jgi:hypothetical protein
VPAKLRNLGRFGKEAQFAVSREVPVHSEATQMQAPQCKRPGSFGQASSSMQSLLNLPRFTGFRAVPHLAKVFQTHNAPQAAAASRNFRVLASKDAPRKIDTKAATLDGVKSMSSGVGSPKIAIPYTDLTVGEFSSSLITQGPPLLMVPVIQVGRLYRCRRSPRDFREREARSPDPSRRGRPQEGWVQKCGGGGQRRRPGKLFGALLSPCRN